MKCEVGDYSPFHNTQLGVPFMYRLHKSTDFSTDAAATLQEQLLWSEIICQSLLPGLFIPSCCTCPDVGLELDWLCAHAFASSVQWLGVAFTFNMKGSDRKKQIEGLGV